MSYRRNDSPDVAGRIHDRLVDRFSAENVYYDVDSIPLGVDFRRRIDAMVRECDVVLVVIGPHWLRATKRGESRLDDPRDFVRVEVESALRRDIRVVPVLVHGADIPPPEELPESIRELSFRHGLPVRQDPDFHGDMNRLIKSLTTSSPALPPPPDPTPPPPVLPPPPVSEPTPRPRYQRLTLLVGAIVLVAGVGYLIASQITGSNATQGTEETASSPPLVSTSPTTELVYAVNQPDIPTPASPVDLELDGTGLLVSLDSGLLQRIDPTTRTEPPGVYFGFEKGGHIFASPDEVAVTTDDCRVGYADTALEEEMVVTLETDGPPADSTYGSNGFWFGCSRGEAYFVSHMVDREEVQRIPLEWRPYDLLIHEGYLYVVFAEQDRIGKVDPGSGLVESILVGDQPVDLALVNDRLWVTISNSDEVAVIDPDGREVIDRYQVGDEPWKIEAGLGSVWVTNKSRSAADGRGTVSRLDPNTGRRLQDDIKVGHEPDELIVGEQAVYVGNVAGNTISVLTAT